MLRLPFAWHVYGFTPCMTCMGIHIGTSGWAYHEWRGTFYPPKTRSLDLLRHYAGVFGCVEINSTAYNTPTTQTIERWRTTVPPGFVAAVKMSHAITHRRRLNNVEGELTEFINTVRLLGDRRGPVLVQLPPSLGPDHRLLNDFLQLAQRVMADPTWRMVVELRHPGWISATTERLLADLHVSWCLADMTGCVVDQPIDGTDLVYIRRHGTAGPYRGSYDESALLRDAEILQEWTRRGAEGFIFFNNTADGSAVSDARRLCALVNVAAADQKNTSEVPLTARNEQP